MTVPLLVNLITSVAMLALSYCLLPDAHDAVESYRDAILTVAQAGLAAVIALVGMILRRASFKCLIFSSIALGLLWVPAAHAALMWSPGDDGGGLGWVVLVGGGCAVSLVIAGLTTAIGLSRRVRQFARTAPSEHQAESSHCVGERLSPGSSAHNAQMSVPLLVNLVTSVAMLALSYYRLPDAHDAVESYRAAIPTVAQAELAAVIALLGMIFRRASFKCLILSSIALGLLWLPAAHAAFVWLGSLHVYDGGGLGWVFLVGGGCAVSLVIAGLTTAIGLSRRVRQFARTAPSELQAEPSHCVGERLSPESSAHYETNAQRKPRHRDRWLWVGLTMAGLYLFWIIAGPISWNTTRTKSYLSGFEIRSIDYHELMPFFPIPILYHVDSNHEQILLIHGREVMRFPFGIGIHPSPSGTHVVVAGWSTRDVMGIYDYPNLRFFELVGVYDTANWSFTELFPLTEVQKEFTENCYGHELSFLRWENEADFLIQVTARDSGTHEMRKQVWRVTAATGTRSRVE